MGIELLWCEPEPHEHFGDDVLAAGPVAEDHAGYRGDRLEMATSEFGEGIDLAEDHGMGQHSVRPLVEGW